MRKESDRSILLYIMRRCTFLLFVLFMGCVSFAGTGQAMTLKEVASQTRYIYLPATQVQKLYLASADAGSGRLLKVKTEEVFLRLTPDAADSSGSKMRLTGQKIACSVTEGVFRDGVEEWGETEHVFLEPGDLQLTLSFGNGSCLTILPQIWFWLYNEEEDLGYAFTLGKWKRDVLRSPNQDDYIEGEDSAFMDGGATPGSPQLGVSASGSNAQGGIYLPYKTKTIAGSTAGSTAGGNTTTLPGTSGSSVSSTTRTPGSTVKPTVRISGDRMVTLTKGCKKTLSASGLIAGDRILGWYSANTSVVRVSRQSGILFACGKGNAYVTVKTAKGASASVRVIVKNPVIRLNKSSITLRVGKKYTGLKAYGLLAGDRIKSWKSSHSRVVKVNGNVSGSCTLQARKKGTAMITVTTKLGAKAKVKVRVK